MILDSVKVIIIMKMITNGNKKKLLVMLLIDDKGGGETMVEKNGALAAGKNLHRRSWFKREQIMKTRTREQTWSLDQFKWHFCNSDRPPDHHLHPPDHHLHPPPDHRQTTVGPPSVHHLHPSAHWTTDGPPPDHRRTTTGPPQSEIRMTLIYDADAEADEEMLTLMSNKNRQTDLHSPRLDFVHSEICTAHSHSILARKRKPISTSMKSIRIRNKGGYPINTPTWTDFGRRKEEEIGGAVAQMKASRRSDGSGGVLERR
ncbi:hypothetical protein LXL04_006748 [Taraxacum kok-saghyz]